jgi:hypothetical protein
MLVTSPASPNGDVDVLGLLVGAWLGTLVMTALMEGARRLDTPGGDSLVGAADLARVCPGQRTRNDGSDRVRDALAVALEEATALDTGRSASPSDARRLGLLDLEVAKANEPPPPLERR